MKAVAYTEKGWRMDRKDIFEWTMQQYGTMPDYPWKDENAVLRHKDNKKWYGVILSVGRDKLGLPDTDTVDVLNVKCDPHLIGSLLMKEGFFPAYHMNKDLWISILLEGFVSDSEIKNLIGISYELTKAKK